MARNPNPSLKQVIEANAQFRCGVEMVHQSGIPVRSAQLTQLPDFEAEYTEFPASFILFKNPTKLETIPEGFDLCHIVDEQESILIKRHPDSLSVDELANCLADSAKAVFDWALNLVSTKSNY